MLLTYSVISFLFKILATTLPTCDVYLQQQGNDFIIDNGNIILKRNQKQSVHADEQSEVSYLFMAVICRAMNTSHPGDILTTVPGPQKYSVRVRSYYPPEQNGGRKRQAPSN